MKWDSYYYLVFNIRNDIEKMNDFFISLNSKNNIYYFLFFLCLPFIPIIWLIIVFYKYFIKYLWLFLDVIFKDLLQLGDNYMYIRIQKIFKYYFYEVFYEVLPFKLFKTRERLTVVYFVDLLVDFILWVFNWCIRFSFYLQDNVPKWYKKHKWKIMFVIKIFVIIYTFIYNIIVCICYWIKYGEIKRRFYIFFSDLYIFLRIFFWSLLFNIWFFFRYICFFDKIKLFILKYFNVNNFIVINNLPINNIKVKLLIFININYKYYKYFYLLFYKYLLLIYYYLKNSFDVFLNNNRDIYSKIHQKNFLIEIKNILLFNTFFIFNRMIIRVRFLKILNNNFGLYEYIIIYWLLNRFWIIKNRLSFFLLKFYVKFNSSSKLIRYYIKKLKK